MAQVLVRNINQGGIADSDYIGTENSVAECVGLDIHSEAGLIKCNQALAKDSSTIVDEFCRARVSCSNGSTYFFGESGGIFEREVAGTWTDRGTAAPAAGSAKILGAEEYQGYIYYFMQSRVGRIAVPSAGGSWAGRNDSWATFTNTDADFHPSAIVNEVLYIGDKNYVAQVDVTTFSANALDLKTPLRISALGKHRTDLLIGTYVSANICKTQIVRWNTWSVSYSIADEIPEVGVFAFLDTDNFVIAYAGSKGNLYIYDGETLDLQKKIKGTWSSTNKATVLPQSVFNFGGLPLFGLSKETGTGVKLGIYSFARTSKNYPYVLNLEFKISTGNLTNLRIGGITPVSADQFLVAWEDTTSGTVVGVDILSLTAKQSGYFITRNLIVERDLQSNIGFIHVPYRTKPASTSINIYSSRNHAAFSGTPDTSVDDTERLIQSLSAQVGNANIMKAKVELVPNENDSPEVEMAVIKIPES